MFDKLHQYIRHVELRRDTVEDWTKYPFSIPAIAALDCLELSCPVTFLMGENGSGKSTLLEAFLGRMRQLVLTGSQFIISSHSPILLAYPGATLYALDQTGITQVAYQDTDHFNVTKAFLQNPERMLSQVFSGLEDEES